MVSAIIAVLAHSVPRPRTAHVNIYLTSNPVAVAEFFHHIYRPPGAAATSSSEAQMDAYIALVYVDTFELVQPEGCSV